jgi:nitrate reductase NapE component
MPMKKEFFIGFQNHTIFKRYLENEQGKVRSMQDFLLLSYGVYDWLSIDLKGGAGNIKQHPVGSDEVDYPSSFVGGYGFRVKLYDEKNLKMVFGFQHISIHPKSTHLGTVKNRAILDDWQTSLLASFDFKKITPYLGTRWSRIDYIHTVGDSRKRVMSDSTKSIGLILGLDLPLTKKSWLNLEGQLLDSEALAFSVNFSF